jgi:glycine oxidase
MHVVIAGAGIIGGSIAWRLAQRGCRVTLLDAGAMGGEASWAGAGMLAPGAEVAGPSAWSNLAMASAAAYPGFVAELAVETGEAIDFRQGGAVEVAAGADEVEELEARVGRQPALGIASRPVDAAELDRLVPGAVLPPHGMARWFPGDAIVDPRDVMRALRKACLARGVAILESSAASEVRWRSGQATVETRSGPIVADAAVLAAGAWNSSVRIAFPVPATFPVRGHLLGYRLSPGLLGPILRRGHTYLLQRTPGLLIAGASSENVGFDRTIDPAVVRQLREQAEALFAPLRGLVPEPWIGFRPATDSLEPEIRPVEDTRIWLACGHFRNGILLAPETARRVVEGLLTGAS